MVGRIPNEDMIMKKRIVAIILSLVLAASAAPAQVYATEPSAVPETEEGTAETEPESTEEAPAELPEIVGTEASDTLPPEEAGDGSDTTQPESAQTDDAEAEWLQKHGLTKNADGMYVYTDENGVVWTYDPEDPELFKIFPDEEPEEMDMEFTGPLRRGLLRSSSSAFPAVALEDPYQFRLNGNFYYSYPAYYKTESIDDRAAVHYGMDVSKHQGVIPAESWSTLRNTYGIDFVFVRVGYRGYGAEGNLAQDEYFLSNIKNAYNAGMAVGVYFFSQAVTTAEAEAEADYLMNLVSGCKDMITLPAVIDYEYAGDNGRLRTAGLSADMHTAIVNAFCARVKAGGYVPGIYANKDMLSSDMVLSSIPEEYRIWMANYPAVNGNTFSTGYAGRLDSWQFTGSFAGFGSGAGGTNLMQSQTVDLDFWYGDFPTEETKLPDGEAEILSAKAVAVAAADASASDTKQNKELSVQVEAQVAQGLSTTDGKLYLVTVNQVTNEIEYVVTSEAAGDSGQAEKILFAVPLSNDFSNGYRQCTIEEAVGDGLSQNAKLRLYLNKLAVAVKDTDGTYKLISEGKYVSDPGAIAYTSDFQTTTSKKGIQSADHIVGDGIDATTGLPHNDLGVSHVFLNLYMSQVMDMSSGGWYEYNGEKYFFNDLSAYLDAVERCNEAGISVTMQVMLDDPSKIANPGKANGTIQGWMINSKATERGKMLYSWENESAEGREAIEAAFSYLGEKFGELSVDAEALSANEGKDISDKAHNQAYVSNWVLGNEINSYQAWQYSGSMTQEQFYESYAQTYRTFYNAIKSVNANARVYICTDNAWNQAVAGYTAKSAVDTVAALLNTYDPTVSWNLAFHPYAHPSYSSAFWNNSDVTQDVSSPFINMSNINVLTDYISRTYGSGHRIILSEQGYSSAGTNTQTIQSAALVYSYYLAATNPMIDAFEIRSYQDEAVEIAQNLYMGLTTFNGSSYTMKDAYYAYKNCDDATADAKSFMDSRAYYTTVKSTATGWGDLYNPYYDASSFESQIYRNRATAEPETPEEPEEPKETTYAVRHYRESLTGEYPESLMTEETLNGIAGTFTEASAKTAEDSADYIGFTAGAYAQKQIAGDGSTVVEIYYARDEKSVQFVSNGGAVIAPVTVKYGATIQAPAVGTKEGHTFAGWYLDPEFTDAWNFENDEVKEDITLYAKWNVDHFRVVFYEDAEDETPYFELASVSYGETVEKPENPVRTGYTFSQWLDEAGNSYSFDNPVKSDLKLIAGWNANSDTGYTVEHYKADLTGAYPETPSDTVSMAGTTGEKTEALAKAYEGFTAKSFAQHTIAADGSTVVKIYYDRNLYTVTFKDADGTTFHTDAYPYGTSGDAVVRAEGPEKDSTAQYEYTFAGWTPEVGTVTGNVVYTAVYQATVRTYEVTFADADGSLQTGVWAYGETPVFDGVPEKTGYEFSGWAPTVMPVSGEAIYTARWTPTRYTITYELNGGTKEATNPDFYTIEDTVEMATPTRTGYTFTGWTGGALSEPEKEMTITAGSAGNLLLTANWEINTYTVSFDSEGGNAVASQTVRYNEKAVLPEAPEKTGYRFSQWLLQDTGYDFDSPVTKDLTLMAQWNAATDTAYTVKHYKADLSGTYPDTPDDTVSMTGTTGTLTEAVAKAYAGFAAKDFGQKKIAADGSTVVEIYYDRVGYTLSFDSAGGSAVAAVSASYGTPVVAPNTPSRAGYDFAGWDAEIPATMPAENLTFTARWIPREDTGYKVMHYREDLDGSYPAALSESDELQGTTGQATAAAARTYAGFTAQGFEQGTIAADGTTVVRIYYTRNTYQLSFDSAGGSAVAPITAKFGSEIIAPSAPKRTGYDFAGWNTELPETMPAENRSYQAQWDINIYTVHFDANGGEQAPADQEIAYNETINAPQGMRRTGYDFVQWLDEKGNAYDFTAPVTKNMTLTAQWSAGEVSYTVEHYLENAEEQEQYTKDEAATVSMRGTTGMTTAAVAKAYAGFTPKTIQQETIAANGGTVVKIYYTRNTYTFTFRSNGGTAVDSVSARYGTMIAAPAAPTRTGYDFAGWSSEIPAIMPAENRAYTALWTPKLYTVTFENEDGTVLTSTRLPYDTRAENIDVPSDPVKAGDAQYSYSFAGWTPEIHAVTGDQTYRASYQSVLNRYMISFIDSDGRTLQSGRMNYGEMPVCSLTPVRTGYTFAGWTPEIGLVISDQTYQTTWRINQYTLTFDRNDGTQDAITTVTGDYGSTVASPADPVRTGYDFVGWSAELPTVMPAENKTYKALWSIKKFTVQFLDSDDDNTVLQNTSVEYGKTAGYTGAAPAKEGKVFIGWKLSGTESVSLELREATPEVSSALRYIAVYADMPNTPEIVSGTEDGPTGTAEGITVNSDVADSLSEQEEAAIAGFEGSELPVSNVKEDELLAEVASALATDGRAADIGNIASIELTIRVQLFAKGSGNGGNYTFEISPVAIARKADGTKLGETKVENRAIDTSARKINLRIPVLALGTSYAMVSHYASDGSSVAESFRNLPIRTSNTMRYVEIGISSFSLFMVQADAAPVSSLPPVASGLFGLIINPAISDSTGGTAASEPVITSLFPGLAAWFGSETDSASPSDGKPGSAADDRDDKIASADAVQSADETAATPNVSMDAFDVDTAEEKTVTADLGSAQGADNDNAADTTLQTEKKGFVLPIVIVLVICGAAAAAAICLAISKKRK